MPWIDCFAVQSPIYYIIASSSGVQWQRSKFNNLPSFSFHVFDPFFQKSYFDFHLCCLTEVVF